MRDIYEEYLKISKILIILTFKINSNGYSSKLKLKNEYEKTEIYSLKKYFGKKKTKRKLKSKCKIENMRCYIIWVNTYI